MGRLQPALLANLAILGIMEARQFALAVVLVAVLCLPTGGSMENLAIKNPVGSGSSTVPQSSISDALVSTPDPFNTDGNLLVTGNVRRGMHFRGSMPYQSPTSFNSSLGSSTLSSFLRDSAGSEDVGTRSGGYGVQPYYSATETVTTTRPGRSEVILPASAMISARIQQDARSAGVSVPGLDASLAEPMSFDRGTLLADSQLPGPQMQYRLLQDSPLGPEGGLSRDASPTASDAGRLSSNQTSIRRQEDASAIERLLDRNQQAESKTRLSSAGLAIEQRESSAVSENLLRSLNQGVKLEDAQTKSAMQMPAPLITDAKSTVTTGMGTSDDSAESSPSSVSTLQGSSTLLKGSGWPGARDELKTGSDTLLPADSGELTRNETPGEQAGSDDTSASRATLSSQGTFDRAQRDVLERLRQQLDGLTKSVETRLKSSPGDTAAQAGAGVAAKPQTMRPAPQTYERSSTLDAGGSGSALSLYDTQTIIPRFDDSDFGSAGRSRAVSGLEPSGPAGAADSPGNKPSPLEELGRMSRAEIASEAKRVMGPHTSLESLSDAKFNEHIRAAEEHLRAGRYYQAADSFSLAAVYKPDHPAVSVGKSHALFAAGEYVSSALFLSRALAAYPEYLRVEVDLVALLGGQDKMARRLADIEQWYARSGSGELQFLLSYVYYRTGRPTEARRAVEAAYQKTPQSPAVRTMKMAIEGAGR